MTKIDELLAVLDMPEDRHWQTLQKIRFPTKRYRHIRENIYPKGWRCYKCGKSLGNNTPDAILAVGTKWCSVADPHCQNDESLADLAFRLRNEVKTKHPKEWYQACFIVSEKLFNPAGGRKYTHCKAYEAEHDILQGKAIWWIIAALIAKELARKEVGVRDCAN